MQGEPFKLDKDWSRGIVFKGRKSVEVSCNLHDYEHNCCRSSNEDGGGTRDWKLRFLRCHDRIITAMSSAESVKTNKWRRALIQSS